MVSDAGVRVGRCGGVLSGCGRGKVWWGGGEMWVMCVMGEEKS